MTPLSIAELKTLTRRRTRKAVRATLVSWGVCFREDMDGWPVVLRNHVEQVLSGSPPPREGPRLAFLAARPWLETAVARSKRPNDADERKPPAAR